MPRIYWILSTCAVMFLVTPAVADEIGQPGPFAHNQVKGVVTKVHPSLFYVKPPQSLRPRTISILKAERLGLHETKVGEELTLVVDSGNVLVDAHKSGRPGQGHSIVTGELTYADRYWEEIELSTPEGTRQFEVDPLAGSKLSVFQEGSQVTVELDETNMMIDIRGAR